MKCHPDASTPWSEDEFCYQVCFFWSTNQCFDQQIPNRNVKRILSSACCRRSRGKALCSAGRGLSGWCAMVNSTKNKTSYYLLSSAGINVALMIQVSIQHKQQLLHSFLVRGLKASFSIRYTFFFNWRYSFSLLVLPSCHHKISMLLLCHPG